MNAIKQGRYKFSMIASALVYFVYIVFQVTGMKYYIQNKLYLVIAYQWTLTLIGLPFIVLYFYKDKKWAEPFLTIVHVRNFVSQLDFEQRRHRQSSTSNLIQTNIVIIVSFFLQFLIFQSFHTKAAKFGLSIVHSLAVPCGIVIS